MNLHVAKFKIYKTASGKKTTSDTQICSNASSHEFDDSIRDYLRKHNYVWPSQAAVCKLISRSEEIICTGKNT